MKKRTVPDKVPGRANYTNDLFKLLVIILAATVFSVMAGAADKQVRKDATGKIEPLPRDLEMQLALSALPPHLRDHATVYVLNPDKGFEVARTGTNGFHAFVARTGDDAHRHRKRPPRVHSRTACHRRTCVA